MAPMGLQISLERISKRGLDYQMMEQMWREGPSPDRDLRQDLKACCSRLSVRKHKLDNLIVFEVYHSKGQTRQSDACDVIRTTESCSRVVNLVVVSRAFAGEWRRAVLPSCSPLSVVSLVNELSMLCQWLRLTMCIT